MKFSPSTKTLDAFMQVPGSPDGTRLIGLAWFSNVRLLGGPTTTRAPKPFEPQPRQYVIANTRLRLLSSDKATH